MFRSNRRKALFAALAGSAALPFLGSELARAAGTITPLTVRSDDVNIQGTALQEWFDCYIPAGAIVPNSVLQFVGEGTLTNGPASPGPVQLTLGWMLAGVPIIAKPITVTPTPFVYRAAWTITLNVALERNSAHDIHAGGLIAIGAEGGGPLDVGADGWYLDRPEVLPARAFGPAGFAVNPAVAQEFCMMAKFDVDNAAVQWRARARSCVLLRA